MFGHDSKTAKLVFNAGILQTFGKLSQSSIDEIDGRPERLTAALIQQYGWQEDVARRRVEAFGTGQSKAPK